MTRVELRPIKHLQARAGQLAFGGTFAYTGVDSLVVVDISNPARASVVGRTAPDPAFKALSVAVAGQYVYATAGVGAGFRVYDTSDPTAPAVVAAMDLPGQSMWVATAADRVYASGFTIRKGLDDRMEYAVYVSIVDVRDPMHPSVVHVEADGASRLQAHDGYLYGTCRRNTLGVFRLEEPGTLVRVGRLALRGEIDAMHLHFPYAHFALARGEACIVDVSVREKPKLVARYPLPGERPIRTSAVAVFDRYTIFALRGLGLHIVDFRDPTRPESVGTYPQVLWMGGAWVHDGHLYVQETADGVHIFKIESEA